MANKLISDLGARGVVANSDLIEVQVSSESLTKKTNVEDLTKIERDARIAQDNVIEASVGLDADGSYPGFVGSNYLDASTDVIDALDILDSSINTASLGEVHIESVFIQASSVRTLGTIPFEIVEDPGDNKHIQVLSCSVAANYQSAAVECGTQKLVLQYDTGASPFMEWSNSFIETGSDIINMGTWTSQAEMVTHKKVEMTYSGGADATAGNTELYVHIVYVIRTSFYTAP